MVEDIVAVMRHAGDQGPGLRINEALSLAESDLDAARGRTPIRGGQGGRRRMSASTLGDGSISTSGSEMRLAIPAGALLCVASGATAGRP
jgi:hypothetical protein